MTNQMNFRQAMLAGAAVAGLMAQAQAVQAQERRQTSDLSDTIGEVVVTGSRVVRDGAQAPTPVTVVSSEQLQKASPGRLGEALVQLPAFRGSSRPSTGNVSATGPNSGSFLNLRNLGPQRTLILLDGRRATPSALLGATDTNMLPQELVSRVDIVTGGASAAYGSDAVSGVVNFVLDTGFTGVKGLVQGGASGEGDAESYKASLTGGASFAGGKGHVIASAGYFRTPGLQDLNDRDWAAAGWGTLPDPTNPAKLLILPNLNSALTSRGGLIVASPATPGAPANLLAGTQFLPGGGVRPYNPGTLRGLLNQVGGDGARPRTNLSAAVTTQNLFAHVDYDLTPSISVFAQGGFAEAHNRYRQVQQFQIPGLNGFTIFSGNAFLPASVQSVMTARGIPAFSMGRFDFDFGSPATADALNDSIDVVAGFKAAAPGGWTIDGYYQHGENRQRIRTEHNVIHERLYAAADAVRDPASGGIVCRTTLTNPGLYPGCVPINLFGEGSPSPEALKYVLGTAYYRTVLKQDVASLSVRGDAFSTWAGPVAVGAGLEYRKEQADQVSDPISRQMNLAVGIRGFPPVYTAAPGGFALTNVQPISGSYDIREGFVEVLAPLAKDMPFAKTLDLNAAVRYTDYSTSGGATTWKVGLTWQPVDDVRLRVTRSHDLRAPNIAELFSGSVQSLGTVRDTVMGGIPTATIAAAVGNPKLDPEEADTTTLGVVYQPGWLPGLTASVDYYRIEVADIIDALSAQQTVDQCAAGSARACANITRNAAGSIIRIVSPRMNLSGLTTSGADIEVSYRRDLTDLAPRLGGELTVRAIVSHLSKMEYAFPNAPSLDRAGEVGLSANPRWSGVLSAGWRGGPWSLYAQERFVGSGDYDKTLVEGVTIADNNVEAVAYTDLTVGYQLGPQARGAQIYVTINNLFDKNPPIVPVGTLGTFYPTNPALYDVIGRYYSMGVTFRF